ncbi:LysR substrate-binding domain-containing protein [Methylosinus sporium]|uniref:LysR substrate-binding domain-containing protein n=1 Tax=Methylosinus sporium TaxID=428 RepID=UPI000D597E1C|nr:LysR substrate-binding domain-containing protein [Methylosinus sporium]PWB89329.1 LysR family transcriptional regulator [Methylocystis sp. MitZ-2018]
MMLPINLDMDVLRSLVVATDLGSFVKAAGRLGRTQSAISLQMKKLEDQIGHAIFRKNGRGVALTDTGDVLLGYARRILALNDEAVTATRGGAVAGSVRLGLPQDLADQWLTSVLGPFHSAYPHIVFEAVIGRSRDLREQVAQGAVDIALVFGEIGGACDEPDAVAYLPVAWIGPRDFVARPEEPLPLALLDAPCMFRNFGIAELDAASLPWRVSFTSPSLPGLWGALEAGLGVTVRTAFELPASLCVLDERSGLPPIAGVTPLSLLLTPNSRSEALEHLRSMLLESLLAHLPEGALLGPALFPEPARPGRRPRAVPRPIAAE